MFHLKITLFQIKSRKQTLINCIIESTITAKFFFNCQQVLTKRLHFKLLVIYHTNISMSWFDIQIWNIINRFK